MKKIIFLFILLSYGSFQAEAQVERREIGNLVIESIPEIPETLKQKLTQYQQVRQASFVGWLPNDEMLITTRFGDTYQLHQVDFPAAYRKQITFFNEPVTNASISPSPFTPYFLFTKDIGGNEKDQIFTFNWEKAEATLITDGTSNNGGILWNRAGDQFVYFSNKRNGKDFDLYISNEDNPKQASLLFEGGESAYWVPSDWAFDDKKLLIRKYISITNSEIYIFDFATGELLPLFTPDSDVAYSSGRWNKDNQGIFYASNKKSDFETLRFFDLKKKKETEITKDIPWDIDYLRMSPDGTQLYFTTNENGRNFVYVLDTETLDYQKLDNLPEGNIGLGSFNFGGDKLAMVVENAKLSGDVFALDISTHEAERWTFSEVGGLNTSQFIVPELIHYETFDKVKGNPRQIPAYYFKPETEGPHPVVVYIHGGPESQFIPGFISTFQYMVKEMGVAIIAPNVRGSSGYGKEYVTLDNAYKREESVKDIGALLDWIELQPELNSEKIMVYGGSYGGYMVLASLVHYNDRLAGGIDVVGISNFVTFLENTSDYRKDLRRVEYGDERDPKMRQFLEEISPANQADKITKPLLIVQGLNDPRVPASESEQMVDQIRKNGGEVWYLLAKDEGHGFAKKVNRDFYQYATMLFIEKVLLDSSIN